MALAFASSPMTLRDEIRAQLEKIVGMRLSVARRAADMLILHFGTMRPEGSGSVGEYALHIQCPWRLDGPEGIVTGRLDLWEPADPDASEDWTYEMGGSLQDVKLREVLGGNDEQTRSHVNTTEHLVVEAIQATHFGDARIEFTGRYRLTLFPQSAVFEAWRFFCTSADEPHFVV